MKECDVLKELKLLKKEVHDLKKENKSIKGWIKSHSKLLKELEQTTDDLYYRTGTGIYR